MFLKKDSENFAVESAMFLKSRTNATFPYDQIQPAARVRLPELSVRKQRGVSPHDPLCEFGPYPSERVFYFTDEIVINKHAHAHKANGRVRSVHFFEDHCALAFAREQP